MPPWDDVVNIINDVILRNAGNVISQVCTWTLDGARNAILIKDQVDSLDDDMEDLESRRNHIKREIDTREAENSRMRQTPLAKRWFEKVDNLKSKVSNLIEEYNRRNETSVGCLGCCSSVIYNIRLGNNIVRMKKEVRKLIEEQVDSSNLVSHVVFDNVILQPEIRTLLNREDLLNEICTHLKDKNVKVVGICGMGGVGKTTLLRKLNNVILQSEETMDIFELVIWVTVSQEWSLEGVQEAILKRIGRTISKEENSYYRRTQNADTLREFHVNKRFLLILDDVWEMVDLEAVGIPMYRSKVLLTTRSEKVCNEMECDETIRIPVLNDEQSWELFRMKLRSNTVINDPHVRDYVKKVVKKCAGLPLAINAVGSAMSRKKSLNDWIDAVEQLETSFATFSGMLDGKEPVFPCLKFSFDRLESKRLQACLLYCCLYPEDDEIEKEYLVDQWIGEGLLEEDEMDSVRGGSCSYQEININTLRKEGQRIIQSLEDACLVEGVRDFHDDEQYIKLHDLVREMALWITSKEDVDGMGRFLVHTKKSIGREVEISNATRRVSLMESVVGAPIKTSSSCPHLETLLLRRSKMGNWHALDSLLPLFCSLRVLDLSVSTIEVVDASIGLLSNLRYLNLSRTRIRSLPKEVGDLKKLKILDLCYTRDLVAVPKEAVCTLSSLERLSLYYSGYEWDSDLSLADLQSLQRLQDLGIQLYTIEQLHGCREPVLKSSIRYLGLKRMPTVTCDTVCNAIEELKNIKTLMLFGMPSLSGTLGFRIHGSGILPNFVSPLKNIKRFDIIECHNLNSISGLCMCPFLEDIYVNDCRSLESLEAEEVNDREGAFLALKRMTLRFLPKLTRISGCQLSWPSLRGLEVLACGNLKELPFGSCSAPHMKEIQGAREWWDKLNWESEDTKNKFCDKFAHCFVSKNR